MEIKCPGCGLVFEPNESLRNDIEKELRSKMLEWQRTKEKQFAEEKNSLQLQLEQSLRKTINNDFESKLKLLQEANKENEEKLQQARQQQLEYMRRENDLKTKEAELELTLQKKLLDEREKIIQDVQKIEAQRNENKEVEYQLKIREMEEKLEKQVKLAEEMKRKAEQGSMQLQGESQELLLEKMLQTAFPFDTVSEVAKGVRGADCTLLVRSSTGQECGTIIYESKRTKEFKQEWIEKLKTDLRSSGAEVGVIVTQVMPKDMPQFGEKDGIWICKFGEAISVTAMLRDGIIKISQAIKTREGMGDKMTLLYNYLTSTEFSEQWKAIREGFRGMKNSIQKEREAMERLWKAREKQLEKVLLNAVHIQGSISGISGMDTLDLNLLGMGDVEDEQD